MNDHAQHYSLRDAIAILDRPLPDWVADIAASKSPRSSWSGASWEDARTLAERGDSETLRRFDDAARRLRVKDSGTTRRRTNRRTIAGGAVDLGAFLSGAPDCMIERSTTESPRRIVRVGVRINAACAVSAKEMAERGCAVGAIVRLLTLQGFSVGVDAVAASEHKIKSHLTITLKAPGEYLDPSILAFWIGHPAALRRCVFRIQEEYPETTARALGVGDSYGRVSAEVKTDHDILIPPPRRGKSPGEYLAEYLALFKQAGISIEGN